MFINFNTNSLLTFFAPVATSLLRFLICKASSTLWKLNLIVRRWSWRRSWRCAIQISSMSFMATRSNLKVQSWTTTAHPLSKRASLKLEWKLIPTFVNSEKWKPLLVYCQKLKKVVWLFLRTVKDFTFFSFCINLLQGNWILFAWRRLTTSHLLSPILELRPVRRC